MRSVNPVNAADDFSYSAISPGPGVVKMAVLVTGASGFIGSAVVRKLLEREETVRALLRPTSDHSNLSGLDVECVTGDLRDPASLKLAMCGIRTVYHVAADYRLWAHDDNDIYETNVSGTENMLRAAADAGIARFVHTSSVCTLGTVAIGAAANEETSVSRFDMIGAYKDSKYAAEQRAKRWTRRGLPVVIVNPSTPIGPRDIKPTPTGKLIQEAARGKMPAYVDTGLNFVHVDDVAAGHLLAHDRGVIGERYVLGGYNLSLKSLLWLIADLTGRRPPKVALPRQAIYPLAYMAEALSKIRGGTPFVTVDGLRLAKRRMYFTSAKAQRELGYSFRPLHDALCDAISWLGIEIAGGQIRLGAYPPVPTLARSPAQ